MEVIHFNLNLLIKISLLKFYLLHSKIRICLNPKFNRNYIFKLSIYLIDINTQIN